MDLSWIALSDDARVESKALFDEAVDWTGKVLSRNGHETNGTNRRVSAESRSTIRRLRWCRIMVTMTTTHFDDNINGNDRVQWRNKAMTTTMTKMITIFSNVYMKEMRTTRQFSKTLFYCDYGDSDGEWWQTSWPYESNRYVWWHTSGIETTITTVFEDTLPNRYLRYYSCPIGHIRDNIDDFDGTGKHITKQYRR